MNLTTYEQLSELQKREALVLISNKLQLSTTITEDAYLNVYEDEVELYITKYGNVRVEVIPIEVKY